MRTGLFCSLLYLPSSSVVEFILLNLALGKSAIPLVVGGCRITCVLNT